MGEISSGWGTCCWSRMQGQAVPVWDMDWKSRVKGVSRVEALRVQSLIRG